MDLRKMKACGRSAAQISMRMFQTLNIFRDASEMSWLIRDEGNDSSKDPIPAASTKRRESCLYQCALNPTERKWSRGATQARRVIGLRTGEVSAVAQHSHPLLLSA